MNNEQLLQLFNEIKEKNLGSHKLPVTINGITVPVCRLGGSTTNADGSISVLLGNFSEVFKLESLIREPLASWAENLVKEKVEFRELDRFVTDADNKCVEINKLEGKERAEAYTVYKDEEVRITAWVDYDFGYKIAKGTVAHVSGFHYRYSIMLRKLD